VRPTFVSEELAGRKVIALFDRAAARDFADVYTLAARFGKPLLLTRAAEIDPGFNPRIFADMLRTLDRHKDSDIPVTTADTATIRTFSRNWTSVKLIAEMSLGTGALAVIGGTLVVTAFLTFSVGWIIGVQGCNNLKDIGVQVLSGFFAAFVEIRLCGPIIAGFGLGPAPHRHHRPRRSRGCGHRGLLEHREDAVPSGERQREPSPGRAGPRTGRRATLPA
jgi:Permease MlaE